MADGERTGEQITSDRSLDFIRGLSSNIKITKGAKFNAQKRLTTQSNVSLVSLSLLSIMVISAGLFVAFFSNYVASIWINIVSLYSTLMASLILFLNAFEYSRKYGVRANGMIRCAHELGALQIRIETALATGNNGDVQAEAFSQEYSRILEKYPDNHSDVDFLKYRWRKNQHEPVIKENETPDQFAHRKSEYKNYEKMNKKSRRRYWLSQYATSIFFIIIPGAIYFSILALAVSASKATPSEITNLPEIEVITEQALSTKS